MAVCKHVGKSSIIVAECMALRDDILAAENKGYSNFEIEKDSKLVIDCYNRRIEIPSSIMLLMEDIWKLSQGLHIYDCRHVYREANRTADRLAKKGIGILESSIWESNFPKDVRNISYEDYHVVLVSIDFVRFQV